MERGYEVEVLGYPAREPRSLDALAAQVQAALPPPESGRAFALVGESFSGPIALRVARTRPAGLRAVVLVASFVRPPLSLPLGLAARVAVGLPAPGFGLRLLLLGARASRAEVRALQRALRRVSWKVLAGRIAELRRLDAREDLAACPAPLLYLRAGADRLVSPRRGEEVAAIRPDLRLETLATPHLLLQRAPAAAAERIDRFLRELESPR